MKLRLYETLGGQVSEVAMPSRGDRSRLIVFCHGDGLPFQYVSAIIPSPDTLSVGTFQEMVGYLTDRNYSVVLPPLWDTTLTPSSTWGTTWGSDQSTTLLANTISGAQAIAGINPSGKYALMSFSMGNMTIMNHFRRVGGTSIAGMLAIEPAASMPVYRGTDAVPNGGAYTLINAGLHIAATGSDAAAAVFDPMTIGPTLTVPWRGWTNSNDATTLPSEAVALAATMPGGLGTTASRGSGGHDFSGCDGKAAHDWFETLAW